MTAEAAANVGDPATLVIGQRVHEGFDEAYDQWNARVKAATSRYPGYVETIVREPNPTDNQWVTVVKFDSVTNMRNWLNSSTRQTLLDEGQHLFAGPATQQVIAGRQHEDDDTLATVVVNFRIAPERSEAFLQFQHALAESNKKYPGFRGSEMFRPIEGVQDTGPCFSGSTTSSISTHGWFPTTGSGCCAAANSVSFR
jgi:antibiotic biosynthesis monooxygenase (ABM) superfamily enzyme